MTNKKQPESLSEALENFKAALIEVLLPILEAVSRFINNLDDRLTQMENERNKRIVLNRQLNNLTDPTLLDRMIQGEKHV
jgi:hypothetical protein